MSNEKQRFKAEDCIMVFLSDKGNMSIDITDTEKGDGEVYITVTAFDHEILTEEVNFLLEKLNG